MPEFVHTEIIMFGGLPAQINTFDGGRQQVLIASESVATICSFSLSHYHDLSHAITVYEYIKAKQRLDMSAVRRGDEIIGLSPEQSVEIRTVMACKAMALLEWDLRRAEEESAKKLKFDALPDAATLRQQITEPTLRRKLRILLERYFGAGSPNVLILGAHIFRTTEAALLNAMEADDWLDSIK